MEKLKSCSQGSKSKINLNFQLVNKPSWISPHEVLELGLKNNKREGVRAVSSWGASFFSSRGERETWVTGDESQGTLLSPSRLPLRPRFHRERDIWVRGMAERIINFLPLKREGLLERGAYLKGGGWSLERGFITYKKNWIKINDSRLFWSPW